MSDATPGLHPAIEAILAHKRAEVRAAKRTVPVEALKERAASTGPRRDFAAALTDPARPVRIIAEVKRSSPSTTLMPTRFDPVAIAKGYEAAGAAALSVLTDSRFFCGANLYVPLIREAVGIPVLRKEFIVDDYQLYETAALGADAVLLMTVNADSPGQFEQWHRLALSLGLTPLVEVHSEADWRMVEGLAPKVVGINNRDFLSPGLAVDLAATERIAPLIPAGTVKVSESGVSTAADIARLSPHADAFLIGSAFMRTADPGCALAALLAPA